MKRKISVSIWGMFRGLSAPQPNAQTLMLYLLTGPCGAVIPGLILKGEAALAEELGWPLEAFRKAFQELLDGGLVEASMENRMIWIPSAMRDNPPGNPNIVKAWGKFFERVPTCALKVKVHQELKAFMKGFTKAFREAFMKAFAKGFGEGFQKNTEVEDCLLYTSPSPRDS